jgi:hypothetical protein
MSEPTYITSPRKTPYNEQTKLTATLVNNIASAVIIASIVAPFLSGVVDKPLWFRLVIAVAGANIALLLHLIARGILSSLKD